MRPKPQIASVFRQLDTGKTLAIPFARFRRTSAGGIFERGVSKPMVAQLRDSGGASGCDSDPAFRSAGHRYCPNRRPLVRWL
jgi:hypothetical protein